MVSDCKLTDMGQTMNKSKLQINNLYKIFGPKGVSFVSSVHEGMSKQELLEKHNHVLGLNNIN